MSLSAINPLGLSTPANNPYLRSLETGGRLVRQAYKRLGELQQYQNQRPPKRPKFDKNKLPKKKIRKMKAKMGSYGSGFFKGSFAPLKRAKPTYDDMVLTKGSGASAEYFGVCQGTETVWVGASTFDLEALAFNVTKATLRKLLKQAGIHITNADVPISAVYDYAGPSFSSNGFTIVYSFVGADGTIASTEQNFLVTQTLNALAFTSDLFTSMKTYSQGTSSNIVGIIRLYQIDKNTGGGAVDTGKLVATLNMRNEVVHYETRLKIVVQNRTRGATGSSDNADVVDAQPLKGKIYHFKKSHPEVREMLGITAPPNTTTLFGRWTTKPIKLFSNQSTGYDQQILNPPSPSFWSNCSKTANISLEPGDLKETYLKNSTSKYFPQFVRSLAWYNGSTGSRHQNVGDSMFIALEERLNSGSANPIKVNYEAEHMVSAYLTTARVDPLVMSNYTENINFVPA